MSFSVPIGSTQEQHPHSLAVTHLCRHPQGGSSVLENRLRSRVKRIEGDKLTQSQAFKGKTYLMRKIILLKNLIKGYNYYLTIIFCYYLKS